MSEEGPERQQEAPEVEVTPGPEEERARKGKGVRGHLRELEDVSKSLGTCALHGL